MSRAKTTYLRLTPKDKKVLSKIKDVLLTETKYYIEPIDVYEVENTNLPDSVLQLSSLSDVIGRKNWGKSPPQLEGIVVSLERRNIPKPSSWLRFSKKQVEIETWYILHVMGPDGILEVTASEELVDIVIAGDTIAIWGQYVNSMLVAQRIYNYSTNSSVSI